ncbi:winged helix-turn-helix transcriptional regulator [Candidatus Daviesbacteria bacterium]|nr:winged helix-turn-helix transcriptional regulator [Candidatus Daviesbacteria bacterium]
MQIRKEKVLQDELQDNEKIKACAVKFGITGDLTRMKLCYILCHHPQLSVSEMAEIIGLPISTVSHSLKKLKEIQVVDNRKQAKQVLYSLGKSKFASVIKSQLLENNE